MSMKKDILDILHKQLGKHQDVFSTNKQQDAEKLKNLEGAQRSTAPTSSKSIKDDGKTTKGEAKQRKKEKKNMA